MLLRYSTVLGLLACCAGVVFADSKSSEEVVFKCATTISKTCFVNIINFENPNKMLRIIDLAEKNVLNIKGGSIEALQLKHCGALSKLEKLLIGRVGLKELCFATSFVHVSAEHNRIRTLHVGDPTTDGTTYRVEVLRLNDNRLESVDSVCLFEALKELHLERNALSTLDMACFAKMRNLEKLYLAANRLNDISSTVTELSFPALNFIDLRNNTLTELHLEKLSLSALELLELASNNLTNVRGLINMYSLSDISLAGNRWQCLELDQMLEDLEKNEVTVKDGDRNCSGIRNGTICCTHVEQSTDETLLAMLNKFTLLKERYDELETKLNAGIKTKIAEFEKMIAEQKEAFEKRKVVTTTLKPEIETKDDKEDSTEPAPKCECTCSKESMNQVEENLKELQSKIDSNSVTLKGLQNSQAQLAYMTVLAKHEFRTAVKRGEHKLKELSTMLAMLREHVKQKQPLLKN
uniref:Leucine rich immune protein (Short) n=1 Tax=Anopheles christyi TaxID=43041 RepID=A0A182JWD1_9DIPT